MDRRLSPPPEREDRASPPFTATLDACDLALREGCLVAGKYRIVEEIGRGGMGIVYKAEDTQLKRTVALKFLPPDSAADPVSKERFTQEARTASGLNHPNVCTIFEVGEAEAGPYIAMEYVEGRSLDALIPADGLPAGDVLRYAGQIVEGLRHAHGRGVIHRDLKASNVAITSEGRIKILDFGLAKRFEAGELGQVTRSLASLTQDGLVAGTLPYLAPEVLHGQTADVRSDIWALGVVLYQMVSGRLPFEGRTGFALTSAILRDAPFPLPAPTPAALREIILKCLEKEPDRRFRSAAEAGAALEAAARPRGPGRLSSSLPAGSPWIRWILAAAGILLAGILVFSLVTRGHPDRGIKSSPPTVSTGAPASPNAEANESFERGMLFLRAQFDLSRARPLLEKALELDPKFAEARAWFGFTFVLEIDSGLANDSGWLYRAERELRQALSDDPRSARAHSALAAVYIYQGRKDLALEEARKGLALDPNEWDSKIWLANYYELSGDSATAKSLLYEILERDPLFFPPRSNLGEILRLEGDLAGSLREENKVLEQDPRNLYANQKTARTYIDMGDLARARRILEGIPPEEQRSYDVKMTWALLLALEGNAGEARKMMDEECLKYAALAVFSTSGAADFYALVGEPELALDWLERAVRNGDERAGWFRRDPLLAKVRDLPRFGQILDSIDNRRKRRDQASDAH